MAPVSQRVPASEGAWAPQVLVVGSVNVDLVVRVARLPGPGETITGGTFERHGGGKGANQAVAAARLGAAVRLVGAVGEDDLGSESIELLAAEGVDVSGVVRLTGVATGVALIVVDARGENQIAVASGANDALEGQMVERALAEHAGATPPRGARSASVCVLSFEVPDAAIVAAAAVARRDGIPIVVSPAPARSIPAELIDARPILTPNELEVSVLAGVPRPDAAARVLSARTRAPVIVTLGAEGALLVDADAAERLPAPEVEAVDTTGAGDTFTGALAVELARGANVRDGVRYALAAASLSVTVSGAREGMPSRDRVTSFLSAQAAGARL
jgi:ribokinase